tara:strand:+ start:1556 stop:2386 length:831 start_codon:yes stop_codon:yes gene_type:complete
MVRITALVLAALAVSASAQNSTLRYMPFGDSITEVVCWRSKLWTKLLQSTEWASVNFVGSGRTENNCKDATYDRDNEGHSGFLAIDIAAKNQLDGWLKTNPADVITMHLGTNDIVQQNKPVAEILAAFTKLVATMRASNARMKIVVCYVLLFQRHVSAYPTLPYPYPASPLSNIHIPTHPCNPPNPAHQQVAQIIPIGIGSYNTQIQALNAAIPAWARGLNSTASPIWVVDQYAGFNAATDLRDGVHPNDAGDVKMLNVWYPAVVRALEAARAERA